MNEPEKINPAETGEVVDSKPSHVIGIGASAGGLEAMAPAVFGLSRKSWAW